MDGLIPILSSKTNYQSSICTLLYSIIVHVISIKSESIVFIHKVYCWYVIVIPLWRPSIPSHRLCNKN